MEKNHLFSEDQEVFASMFFLADRFADALDLHRSLFDDRQITFMQTYIDTANKLKNLYQDLDPEFFCVNR